MNNPVLSQLRDIHLPEPISWWPLAIGWYFLGAFFVGIVGIILFVLLRRYRKQGARRFLIKRLEALREQYQRESDARIIAAELSILLRRASLILAPRNEVASLKGEQWLEFLDRTGDTQEFSKGIGRVLISAPYQKETQFDVNHLLDLVLNWVRHVK